MDRSTRSVCSCVSISNCYRYKIPTSGLETNLPTSRSIARPPRNHHSDSLGGKDLPRKCVSWPITEDGMYDDLRTSTIIRYSFYHDKDKEIRSQKTKPKHRVELLNTNSLFVFCSHAPLFCCNSWFKYFPISQSDILIAGRLPSQTFCVVATLTAKYKSKKVIHISAQNRCKQMWNRSTQNIHDTSDLCCTTCRAANLCSPFLVLHGSTAPEVEYLKPRGCFRL